MKAFNFRHPLLPSILAEFAFPLLGYFLWNWNLFYIVMFYAADMISITILIAVKQKWVVFPPEKTVKTDLEQKALRRGIFRTSTLGLLGFAVFFVGLSYAFHLSEPQHQSWGAIILRFFKEEFLILLVLPLARWLEFTMFFKMRRRYLAISQKTLIQTFLKNQGLIVGFTGIAILLALFSAPQLLIIVLGVSGKLIFDLWKMQQL